jgi:conjugal transfer/entry exclusion protein
MRISSRRILTIGIVVLVVTIIIELGVVLGTAFAVPDLAERIQRISAIPRAAAPPLQQSATTLNNARPLSITDTFDVPSPRWDQSAVSVQNSL